MCFVDAEWKLLARFFEMHGVIVAWPKAVAKMICQPGPLEAESVQELILCLAKHLPPA
jgi:hypothetical protein